MNLELETKIKDAVAVVYFKGLGIVAFNEQQIETMFIHADKHSLNVKIYRPVSWDEYAANEDLQSTFNGVSYLLVEKFDKEVFLHKDSFGLHSQVKIEIDNGSEDTQCEKWGNPNFLRNIEDTDTSFKVDRNDFGWVLDLKKENLFAKNAEPLQNTNYARSRMILKCNYIFAQDLISDNGQDIEFNKIVDVQNMKGAVESDLKEEKFGRMADNIGAVINGEFVRLSIKWESETRQFVFGKTGEPYVIEITNDGDEQSSDMGIYRQFWNGIGAETFDLVTETELVLIKKNLAKPIGIRKTCNMITAEDLTSTDLFFGLQSNHSDEV